MRNAQRLVIHSWESSKAQWWLREGIVERQKL